MPGRSRVRGLIHSKLSFTLQRFRLFGIALKEAADAMGYRLTKKPTAK